MIREPWRTASWNLALLLIGILPLFFLLTWLQVAVQGSQGSREPGYMLETGVFYYIAFAAPVALGGALYQLVLSLVPSTASRLTKRTLAVFLTAVIPASVVLLGQPADVVLWFAVPLGLSLIAYGLAVRIQPREPTAA